MSVLRNLDIDLPQSERKSLYRFLSLYIFFTIITLFLISYLYYTLQKELIVQQRTILLNQYANEFIIELKDLHNDITNTLTYPINKRFKTTLYDKNYNIIYSTLDNPKIKLTQISYTNNKIIRYIKNPQEYYLNTQYVIVQINDNNLWFQEVVNTIILYGVIFFICMIIIGYFLMNLFLKPMKDALHLLDTFIKDTTHELNTPVSTIMTNIELIEKDKIKDIYLLKIINRIDIGAKTISNIYDDLTYLILNNQIISNNKDVNLKEIIEERVEYFTSLANIKKIKIIMQLNIDTILTIDKKKLSKLIDNILSNAIKYNRVGGTINIELNSNNFFIKDTGRGIKKENIKKLFNRYSRFNKSVGGFGIGLNIVKMICKEYNLNINISSKLDTETKVLISWS